jgi:hypothetical protein
VGRPASHCAGLSASTSLCQKPYLLASGGLMMPAMPGFGQNEAPFAPEQRHALPGSLPEGDVIVHGGHQQHRGLHLGESDAGVADLELPFTSWFSR